MRHLLILLILFWSFSGFSQELTDSEFALIQAAEAGKSAEVLKLLEKGVNPNCAGWDGMTPLHYAVQNGHLQTCKVLVVNGSKFDQTDTDNRTPLLLAVHFNQLDPAEYLVRKGADVNIPDFQGLTPLFYAAAYGDYTMTDMFLFYKGNQSVQDADGKTPFMAAIWGGFPDVAKILLDYGANINKQDQQGQTALMLAILNQDSILTDSLIRWMADLEAETHSGYTALELAVSNNFIPGLRILLAAGAQVNHEIQKGFRTLDYAISHGASKEAKELLKEAGALSKKAPSFTKKSIGLTSLFGTEDRQLGLRFEWLDPRYNLGIQTGLAQRLGRLAVLDPENDTLSYLLHETRTTFTIGLEKRIALIRFDLENQAGILFQGQLEASAGDYKASSRKPPFQLFGTPSLGFFLQGSAARLELGYRYNLFKNYLWNPSSLFFNLHYLIQNRTK